MDGSLYVIESVELKKSAVFVGDIYTPGIAIDDGASFGRKHTDQEGRSRVPDKERRQIESASCSVAPRSLTFLFSFA